MKKQIKLKVGPLPNVTGFPERGATIQELKERIAELERICRERQAATEIELGFVACNSVKELRERFQRIYDQNVKLSREIQALRNETKAPIFRVLVSVEEQSSDGNKEVVAPACVAAVNSRHNAQGLLLAIKRAVYDCPKCGPGFVVADGMLCPGCGK